MADPTDLTDTIAAEAQLPASSASDGQSATGQPLPDLIEADKYVKGARSVAGKNAGGGAKSGWRGVRMARGVPPGAT